MTDTDREARILELRYLVQQGEYQTNPEELAASLVDAHLSSKEPTPEQAKPVESAQEATAS
jgi:hypothetical protein